MQHRFRTIIAILLPDPQIKGEVISYIKLELVKRVDD